jgi:AraC-like DNA-binding protein
MSYQAEQFSHFIGEIYDAAIDASQWSAVLGKAAKFVGGPSAALFSKDAASASGKIHYECGADPHYRQLYCQKYGKLDPATIGHVFAEIEQPISIIDLMPYDEFLETVTDLLALLLNSGDVPETEPAKSVAVVSDWTPGISDVHLQAAKSYIIERAHDQISLGQVAKHLGIPERRLQRLFGSRAITFTTFLKDVRLARVYDMLCDPDSDGQRIRSICFAAGFRDISHFNRLFRARYGCTPAEVRASRREDTSR